MARLILLSASRRRSSNLEPLPAIERYQGVYFRVLKKYLREGRLKDTDILIVSEKFGVLRPKDLVPYHKPFEGKLGKEEVQKARQANLTKLAETLSEKQYSEIFVVCGREFQKLIDSFQNLTNTKVVFCEGAGLGPKAQNLKKWILSHTR